MKKLFTLFIALIAATIGFSQAKTIAYPGKSPVAMKVDTKRPLPSKTRIRTSLTRAAASACDTMDMLDFNTYNEVKYKDIEGLNFTGSWNDATPQPYGAEITSYLDANHAYDLAYVGAAFDSLAFQDFTNQQLLAYPLATSTITLDSIGVIVGISGDTTVADGLMTNDSLVFSIYSIVGHVVGTTPVKTVVLSGYAGLSQFFAGAGYLGYSQVGINQTFAQGQGFFVKMNYIAKDTSSHMTISYTYADSCGTVTYQGQSLSSPAYVPALITSEYLNNGGSTFYGQIGATGAVQDASNAFAYSIPSTPANCTYVYNQNFEILPIINVCVDYGAQITATPTGGCPGSNINLSAAVYGTTAASTVYVPNQIWSGNQMNYDNSGTNPNLTYTWSTSAGTLSGTSGQATSVSMPTTGNVTVSLDVNDGTNDVTTTYVVTNNPITLAIANTPLPVQLPCGGTVTLRTTPGGTTTGHSYHWSGLNLDTTNAAAVNLKVSYPGTYYVTVTNSAGCTATDSVVVVNAGASNTASFTVSTPVCQNKPATFTNTSTSTTNWAATWYFGDPANDSSSVISPAFTYTVPGSFEVQLIMDSAGCKYQSPRQNVIVYSSTSNTCLAGIEDVAFDDAITMMPNPTNGTVNIAINGLQNNLSIKVYNILGSEVHNFTASDLTSSFSRNFDFSNLANGTYLVKIQSGNQIAVKRLVITK